jgi:hypothetical protein
VVEEEEEDTKVSALVEDHHLEARPNISLEVDPCHLVVFLARALVQEQGQVQAVAEGDREAFLEVSISAEFVIMLRFCDMALFIFFSLSFTILSAVRCLQHLSSREAWYSSWHRTFRYRNE